MRAASPPRDVPGDPGRERAAPLPEREPCVGRQATPPPEPCDATVPAGLA